MKEDLRKWFGKGKKGDWVRVGTDGEIKGQCAREPGEGKPKCMPRDKAHSMSKKDRASSARRKRRADPVADRPGTGNKPIMVKTDKKESMNEKNVPTNPKLWAKFKAQAKAKFDVYPSAYANGWAAKQYKAAGGGWKTESVQEMKTFHNMRENLQEKSVSQAQQKMMGMALAYKRGEMDDASPEVKKMANSMSMKDLEDFAKTKHKGLPVKKESAELDEMNLSKHDTKKLLQFYRKYADKKMGPSDANQVRAVRRELIKRGAMKEDTELEEWQKETPWKKSPQQRKDKYGNVIKTKNIAKNLAKSAQKQTAKEDVALDELSIDKLRAYRKKAVDDVASGKKTDKRTTGVAKASNKIYRKEFDAQYKKESVEQIDEAKGTGVKKFVKGMRVAKTSNPDMKGTVIKGGDNMKKSVEVEWDSGTTTLASGKYLMSIKKNESVDLGEAGSFRKKFNKAMTWSKDFTGSPKDMQDRIRSYSDDELRKLSGKRSPAGDGSARQAQIKMIDREMRRRGIKESVDLDEAKISVGDRVTLKPNKNTLDQSLIGKAGVVTGMVGSKPTVKFANGKTIAVSPKDLTINESVELDEASYPLASKWQSGAKVVKKGKVELTRGSGGVHSIKVNGKSVGDFSLDDDSGMWVTNVKGKKGQGTYDEIDDIVNAMMKESVQHTFFTLREARRDAAKDLYFDSYSAAVQTALADVKKKGFEVDEDDWHDNITTGSGKPGRGKTVRHTIGLTKGGKPQRKALHIQVYNRNTDKKTYELNYYVS